MCELTDQQICDYLATALLEGRVVKESHIVQRCTVVHILQK